MSEAKLAIVIPAYRSLFFADALESLAAQTDQNFHVYVGDDFSPENVGQIAAQFSHRLQLSYTRFPNNVGARNLVSQWNRCVRLVRDEHWVWVFSDDDIADPRCVECFFGTLRDTEGRFDVYRFNTLVIDRESKVIATAPVGPVEESAAEMAYHLLLGERGNSMPDHIFRRSAVDANGGFVFTEYAQAADWASSIFFASRAGIRTIDGASVRWRVSGQNISSLAKQQNQMVGGYLQFLVWLLRHFQGLKASPGPLTFDRMHGAALVNLRKIISSHYGGLRLANNLPVYRLLRSTFGLSPRQSLLELLAIHVKSSPRLLRFYRWAWRAWVALNHGTA